MSIIHLSNSPLSSPSTRAMGFTTAWKRLSPTQLNIAIQTFALISIFFEGYDQGVMGGVNASPNYVSEVKIGQPDGTVTNTTKQGGIVSIYYLGAIVGCFVGGWAADRIGRINGLFFAAIFALVGGALQAATQSADFILVARVVTGLGTGALTGITPVLVSEVSSAEHRGGFLGYVFIANYLGISVAYWLDFGLSFVNNGYSAVRWRFLLGFQCLPALLLLAGIKMLPDSPRYLASVGRNAEAREVLERVRGSADPEAVEKEFNEIVAMAEDIKPASPIEFIKIMCGLDKDKGAHLGRRAWLCIWLQIMASWTASRHDPSKAASIAPAAVTMLFLFNLVYASTWGTVAFLIPTEIFPSRMRAQGNGFGITGWAIGVGWTVLVNPIMFENIQSRTYFLFAGLNFIWIGIVYLIYPETSNRSLESIEAMFTTSPFYWQMEKAYAENKDMFATGKHEMEGDRLSKEKELECSHDELPHV
ncbi:unnamed protein product [Aureobasidium uvarum]|uniref:Major facilitator superfamily (MFS) profile domain-containing protein n=1 Tax=Aureobasidium uvarum TaxID=2773716 RepID=A0A9N8KH88_9PEZI|nr:unnamed protein product [Aureobasidium uvarum]